MCKGCHDHPQKTNKQKKEVKSSMTGKRLFTIVKDPLRQVPHREKVVLRPKKKKKKKNLIHIFTKGVTKARSKHRNAHVPNLMQMRENNRSSADRIKFATCEMRRFKRALLASTPTFPKTAFIHLHTFMSFTEEFFRPIIYICMFIYFPKSSNFSLLQQELQPPTFSILARKIAPQCPTK